MQSNRRSFLVASGLTALAASRAVGANEKIPIGAIGCGGRMRDLLRSADKTGLATLISACDVYEPRRDEVRERYANTISTHLDYREVLDDKEIAAVIIATPDHWHVRVASDAIASGKDVYLEKPVTHTLEEGAVLTKAVRSSQTILQCGMQQRSWSHFRSAVDLIQGGSLGRVPKSAPTGGKTTKPHGPPVPIDTVALDWKHWLGNAPDQPFSEEKFFVWRRFWNFGGGAMTDLFTHWVDVVHWAMKSDEPRAAHILGDKYVFEHWDCPTPFRPRCAIPDSTSSTKAR